VARHLERLLWRHRAGIVSGDTVAEALEKTLQQLVDERFACPMNVAPASGTSGAWLSSLCDLESSIEHARAWTREARFDRAVRAARQAEVALKRMQLGIATTQTVTQIRDNWLALVAKPDLSAFQHCSTLLSINYTLEKAEELLRQGAIRKAKFVAAFANRQIAAMSELSQDTRLQRELRGRITRLRTGGLDTRPVASLKRIVESSHLRLAGSLLDDLEMELPLAQGRCGPAPGASPAATQIASRFERIAGTAGALLVELERCAPRSSTQPTTS